MSVRLLTLGVPACRIDDRELPELPVQKARFALVVYLAIERNVSRDEIVSVFWADSDDEHARHALSQSLYELKRLLGDSWVKSHAGRLVVSDDVVIDARDFANRCNEGSYEHAVDLYRGPFLSGFFLSNCKGFETWVDRQRAQLERTHRKARRESVNHLVEAKRTAAAIEMARRWVELDPFDDEANHRLIELLSLAGDRTAALREFSAYERRLREELDVEPLDNTKQLIDAIRNETASLREPSRPVPTAAISKPSEAASAEDPVLIPTPGLVTELSRRRVLRMAIWYAATVFAVIQFAQLMQEAFYLPPWILTATAVLCIAGFPLAVLLSWQFDMTADGLKRTRRNKKGKSWRVAAIALLLVTGTTAAAISVGRSLFAREQFDVVCADGSHAPCRRKVPMRANLFAVLPLRHEAGSEPGLLTGELCARMIKEGMLHWQDINVADDLVVKEALRHLAPRTRADIPIDTAIAVAHEIGAGKLITGTLWQDADSTVVVASMYDAIARRSLNEERTRFATGTAHAKAEFYRLAARLVLREARVTIPDEVAMATQSHGAMLAVDSAWKAIDRWDLEAAQAHLFRAVRRDPNYAYAHLGIAQVMLWQNKTGPEWVLHANRAQAGARHLVGVDKYNAAGIAALSERKYQQSCAAFRAILARDSMSFMAWYGLSECLYRDETVRRDSASPSGWSFATSYDEAIRSHLRALYLVPSFQESFRNLASSRLNTMLFGSTTRVRGGVGVEGDTVRFLAYPFLQADTVAFVPYTRREFARMAPPTGNAAAIERNREYLRDAVMAWVRSFPRSPRALEALAGSLELSGLIAPSDSVRSSALAAVRRAMQLENQPEARLRLEATEIRILVKLGRYREARRRAQAVLRANKLPEPAAARRLAGIAGLTGQPHLMAQLLVAAARDFDTDLPITGENFAPPMPLAREASALLAYAYFGLPVDSIRHLTQRAHNALDAYVAPEQREVAHAAVLDRAARMAFPVLGADDAHRASRPVGIHMTIQAALARRDTATVRRLLLQLDSLQRTVAPTDVAADGVLNEVQLLLALRYTTAAEQTLDAYLNGLAAVPPSQFNQPYQPVSIVRLMALRAELAAGKGQRAVARKWSRAVVDLWQDGSAELKPMLGRMRSLARS